jgi:hypothetical protein
MSLGLFIPGVDSTFAGGIDHADEPNRTGISIFEFPGSGREGGPLACQDIHIAANLLNGWNTRA